MHSGIEDDQFKEMIASGLIVTFALRNMTSPSNLKTVDYLCIKFCFILVHSPEVKGGYLLDPSIHVITASASGLKKNAMERR